MTNLLGVSFDFTGMSYYSTNKELEVGAKVVCTTAHGTFVGEVKRVRKPEEEELKRDDFITIYPPIDRVASFQDVAFDRDAKVKEKEITRVTQEEADNLNLEMRILSSYLDISGEKVLITFIADNRVDFRELVKILIGYFHLRVELRQIGPRDQAKLVGGIGPCGLPFCCTTFLSSFDGISIAMAKNQLLAINIPKLSGQCGKLMCCLKYEDDAYTKAKEGYPKIGDKITYRKSEYEVTTFNVLSGIITAYNGESYEYFTLEQYNRVLQGLDKGDEEDNLIFDVNANVNLSGHGISDTNERLEKIKRFEELHSEEIKKEVTSPKKNDRYNKNNKYNNRKNYHKDYQNKKVQKDSGFIPVSQIADREVLNVKAVRKGQDEDE